jgi:hypothetical protein
MLHNARVDRPAEVGMLVGDEAGLGADGEVRVLEKRQGAVSKGIAG